MTDTKATVANDSVARDAWIDALCDRYEAARKAGQAVTPAEFLRLAGVEPAAVDPHLHSELAKLAAVYGAAEVTRVTANDPKAASLGTPYTTGQIIAGRYKLMEVIGEGGMGTVYRAEQTVPVKRNVALKLIRFGMDSRAVLARFEAERQALALMDHPNIARIFDGGTTLSGQPFFVMELVNGIPITDYCDRHQLPVRERLKLFLAVCHAVEHAHMKGIIHRDLKPRNILVTESGGPPAPKVIDFGVAKATEGASEYLKRTDPGKVVGTPSYMSPEQAAALGDIDVRADVYALGAVLYELLAGSPPFEAHDFKRGGFMDIPRTIQEVDPPKPSQRVGNHYKLKALAAHRRIDPAQLKKVLQRDLDWIVMKSLEKDRNRRYGSVVSLGADIVRYLLHEPVKAVPPSGIYRVRKFVRKNRNPVCSSTLLVLALLGAAGTTYGLIHRPDPVADPNLAALITIFSKIGDGKARPNGELADEISRLARNLEGGAISDPLQLAEVQSGLGEAFLRLKDPRLAIPLFTKAWETYDKQLGPNHPKTVSVCDNLNEARRMTEIPKSPGSNTAWNSNLGTSVRGFFDPNNWKIDPAPASGTETPGRIAGISPNADPGIDREQDHGNLVDLLNYFAASLKSDKRTPPSNGDR